MDNINSSKSLTGKLLLVESVRNFNCGVLYGRNKEYYLFFSKDELNVKIGDFVELTIEPLQRLHSIFPINVAFVRSTGEEPFSVPEVNILSAIESRNRGKVKSVNPDSEPIEIELHRTLIKVQWGKIEISTDGIDEGDCCIYLNFFTEADGELNYDVCVEFNLLKLFGFINVCFCPVKTDEEC